jgi:hypothetical protein
LIKEHIMNQPFKAPYFYSYRGKVPHAELTFWVNLDACIARGDFCLTNYGR